MNNRLNDNFKKNTVSEYFKIRARANVESSGSQQPSNETAVSAKEADSSMPSKFGSGKERFRNEHEFEADAIKLPEYFMQFKGTATVVGW